MDSEPDIPSEEPDDDDDLKKRPWQPEDVVAGAIALVVSTAMIGVLANFAYQNETMETHQADNVRLVLMALVNIVSMWMGAKLGRHMEHKQ